MADQWHELYKWLGEQIKSRRKDLKGAFGVESLEAHTRIGQLQDVRIRMRELDPGLPEGKADEPWTPGFG